MLNPDKFNYVPSQKALIISAFESPSYAFKWVHTPFVTDEYGNPLKGWEVSYLPSDEKGKLGCFFWDGVDADGCFHCHIEMTLIMEGDDFGAPYVQYGDRGPYVAVKAGQTYGLVGSRIICLSSATEVSSWKPKGTVARVWNDFSQIEIVK